MVCKRVYYWGKVQGVGFRYTVHKLAENFPVTGYVRNMLDGQVELVAEGGADSVKQFLDAVWQRMAGHIQGHKVEDQEPHGYEEFQIRS